MTTAVMVRRIRAVMVVISASAVAATAAEEVVATMAVEEALAVTIKAKEKIILIARIRGLIKSWRSIWAQIKFEFKFKMFETMLQKSKSDKY